MIGPVSALRLMQVCQPPYAKRSLRFMNVACSIVACTWLTGVLAVAPRCLTMRFFIKKRMARSIMFGTLFYPVLKKKETAFPLH